MKTGVISQAVWDRSVNRVLSRTGAAGRGIAFGIHAAGTEPGADVAASASVCTGGVLELPAVMAVVDAVNRVHASGALPAGLLVSLMLPAVSEEKAGEQESGGTGTDSAEGSEEQLRQKVWAGLKTLGFAYVTLDLQGYRTGSMNL